MSKKSGFTLIELLVTIAIISILAAIAIPNYSDYVTRGRLADGVAQLADARVKMEQFFQDNRTYAGAPICNAQAPKPKGFATFTCPTATATAFTIQAASDASLGAAGDYTYTIDQNGARVTTKFKGGAATCATGWQTRKGETC